MFRILFISAALLFAFTINSYSADKSDVNVTVTLGIYLGGNTNSGIDCAYSTTEICYSTYKRNDNSKMGLYVSTTNDGVCDIDGTNVTEDPTTGNTTTTIQNNASTFYVNTEEDLWNWILL